MSLFLRSCDLAAVVPGDAAERGRTGLLAMVGARISGMVIGLLSSAVLGRLLTPEDYGLVAMATTLMILLNLLKDFGLSSALVQAESLNADQLNAVFWMNLAVACCLAAVGVATAPWVARFYGHAELTSVVYALCAALIASAVSGAHTAMLRRHLRFGALMSSEVVGQVAGLVVGVGLAWLYRSYWAIVASQIAAAVVSTVVVFAAIRWVPGWPVRVGAAAGLVRFGANISAFSLLNFFSNQLGAIMAGAWLGAGVAGHFNRAQQLLNLTGSTLIQPVGQTALPVLCRLQADGEAYRRYYVALLERTSLFFGLLGAFVVLCGDAVAIVLLGPQWTMAGEMYRWFGLAIMAVGMASQTGNVLISQGRSGALRNWGVGDALIRASASVIGVLVGAVGIAAAFGVSTLFVTVPIVGWIVSRSGPVGAADQFGAMRSGCLVAAVVCATGLALRNVWWPQLAITSILAGAAIAACGLIVVAGLDRRTRTIVFGSIDAARSLLRKTTVSERSDD